MRKSLKPLGQLEQMVMDVVWHRGCATVRCVFNEVLEKRGGKIAYTTVMTTMDRLAKKGVLKRKKIGKAYEYSPVNSEDQLKLQTSKSIIEQLIKNYGDLAVAQFVDIVEDIDPSAIDQLKKRLSDCK